MADRDEMQAAVIAALRAGMRADTATQGLAWFTEELAERGFAVVARARLDTLLATENTAAEQGTRLCRAHWALKLIRHWCISDTAFSSGASAQLRDWIDAGGPQNPVPWPKAPAVEQWALAQGWTPHEGSVSIRFTLTLERGKGA